MLYSICNSWCAREEVAQIHLVKYCHKTNNFIASFFCFCDSKQMNELEKIGMLKGTLNAKQQLSLISGCTDLKAAVEGAIYVQVSGASDTDRCGKQLRFVDAVNLFLICTSFRSGCK